tara:strand:+ start:899 stop:1555 length:657 start_codon:yes stop_codon:yes gene_type:complete
MKIFNQISTLFIFSILLFSSCKTESKSEEEHKSSNLVSKEHKIDDSRPDNAITYKEMASMFHQYDIGQKPILDAYRKDFSGDKEDVASISHFYEIKQLKQYIAYLERLSKEKDIELTGIRIFSAAYPKDYKPEKGINGRHSLILMPTANIKGKNVAYEPLYSKKGNPIPFTEFLDKFSSKETKQVMRASFLSFLTQQDDNDDDLLSSGANRAKVYPPE